MAMSGGGGLSFRIGSEASLDTGCGTLSCEASALATDPGVVTAVVIAGFVAFLAFTHVRDGKGQCREEQQRVVAERDAFESFADRVSRLDAAPVAEPERTFEGPVGTVRRSAGSGSPGDVRLHRVLGAYRDTVMAVPHYAEEYDESVAESLSAELGEDTVTSLASNGTLSPGLQSTLVDRSRQAARARSSLSGAIDAEIESLSNAETTLESIDRRRTRLNEHLAGLPDRSRSGAAIDVWERLADLEDECDAVAADRQAELADPPITVDPAAGTGDDPTFHDYLYGGADCPRYPVLSALASLAESIREDRERVARHVADAP